MRQATNVKSFRPVFCGLLALSVVLIGSTVASASSKVQVPEWVAQTAAAPTGNYSPRTNAVVLLDETTVHYNSPLEYVETRRVVTKILRPEGRDYGLLSVPLRGKEKVESLHGWAITASGTQFEVQQKEFIDHSTWGDELYSDSHNLSAKISGAEVGSVVALEYCILRHPFAPTFDWLMQGQMPVKESRFTLEMPDGWEQKASWTNMAAQTPANLGGNRWQWTVRNLQAIDDEEEYRPSNRAIAARASFSFVAAGYGDRLDTWKGIGAWSHQLSRDRHNPSPEITAKVQSLTAGLSGFDAVTSTLAAFVQSDVRYVAIEIGIGGWQPHYADEIFRHRYGDCKDKATLLAAMLQAAGIRSALVSVHHAHGAVHQNLPSLWSFDHEILAIELPEKSAQYRSIVKTSNGKRYLIFDPTSRYTPFGELSSDLQGNLALLELEGGGELVRLPLHEPEHSQLVRTGKFTLQPDGSLSGDVEEHRTGTEAYDLRGSMLSSTELDRTRALEHMINHQQKGFALKQSKLEHLEDLSKDLLVQYSITADHYAQTSGPLLLVRPRVLGQKSLALQWRTRKYPVDLSNSTRQT
ncbi:MAG TPA: DUF3857 and transglutaminase domain-containing protein, partial [Terriglobales bacterium]